MSFLLMSGCSRVLEYGSGGSTLALLRHVGELHTVEHEDEWFEYVAREVEQLGHRNWRGMLLRPVDKGKLYTGWASSKDASFLDFSFENYVNYAERFEDNYFDAIIIDGRARSACVDVAARKAKNILVLDNSERDQYQESIKRATKRSCLHVSGPARYVWHYTTTSFISLSDEGDRLIEGMRQNC